MLDGRVWARRTLTMMRRKKMLNMEGGKGEERSMSRRRRRRRERHMRKALEVEEKIGIQMLKGKLGMGMAKGAKGKKAKRDYGAQKIGNNIMLKRKKNEASFFQNWCDKVGTLMEKQQIQNRKP